MTKTYYHRSTAAATGVHAATNETEQATTAGAGAGSLSDILAGGASQLAFCFTTASGEPNSADWPSGTYRCILEVSTAGANITYGLRTAGAVSGHFARVNSGLTADSETVAQAEALFSGTGIKTATASWDPAAGNASDRFECLIAATRPASHGNETLTIVVDATDAGATNGGVSDGPWTVVADNPVHDSHGVMTYVSGTATTAAIPVPSGTGGLLVVSLYKQNTAAITPPTGFQQKSQVANSSVEHTVYYKQDEGESGTLDFTWTGQTSATGSAHRISGAVTSGDPFSAFDHEFSNTGNANTPAVQIADTINDDVLLLWFGTGFGGSSNWIPPTAFTEVFQATNLTAAWLVQATAGDTGSLTGSSGNTDVKNAFLGAIKPAAAGADATVTPDPVVVTATMPQAAAGVGAAPAVIAGTSALPQAAVGVGATVASVAASTSVPEADVSVGAAPSPVAVAAALPLVASAGENITTVTPGPVPAVATLPQPAVGVGAAPAVAAVAAALPQAAIGVGTTPATLAVTTTAPLATAGQGDTTVTPDSVPIVAALPQPGVGVGAAPAVISALVYIGSGLAVDVGVTPDTAPIVVGLPQATPDTGGGNATVAPDPVAAVAAVLQAAVGTGAAPSPVAGVAALPQAAVGVGTAPAPIAAVGALPQAAIAVGVTPAVVAAVAALLQPAVSVGVAPELLVATVALPQASPDGGAGTPATVTPDPVAVTAALPQAAVGVGVAQAVTALQVALPTATIAVHATAEPAAVALVATFPQPAVGVGVAPTPVAVVIAVLQPDRVGPPFEANINPAGPVIVGVITVDPDAVPGATTQRGGMVGGIG